MHTGCKGGEVYCWEGGTERTPLVESLLMLIHNPAWSSHIALAFSIRLQTRVATFRGIQTLELLLVSKLVVVRVEKLW